MPIAHRIGRDQVPIPRIHIFRRGIALWQLGLPGGTHRIGHFLPHWPLPHALQRIERIIEHPMPEGTQAGPVFRVQRRVSQCHEVPVPVAQFPALLLYEEQDAASHAQKALTDQPISASPSIVNQP